MVVITDNVSEFVRYDIVLGAAFTFVALGIYKAADLGGVAFSSVIRAGLCAAPCISMIAR